MIPSSSSSSSSLHIVTAAPFVAINTELQVPKLFMYIKTGSDKKFTGAALPLTSAPFFCT